MAKELAYGYFDFDVFMTRFKRLFLWICWGHICFLVILGLWFMRIFSITSPVIYLAIAISNIAVLYMAYKYLKMTNGSKKA